MGESKSPSPSGPSPRGKVSHHHGTRPLSWRRLNRLRCGRGEECQLCSGWAMPVPRRGAHRPLCSCWLAFLLSLFLHTFLCHPWLAKKCAFWVLVTLTRIQLRHAGWLRRQGLTSMSQNLLQIDNCCFPWQGFFLCATLMTAIPCLVATDEVQLTPRWWRFPLGKYCSLRGQTWENK